MLRLLRLIYGFQQSGCEWNKKAKKHLKSIGFEPITEDNCIFFNKSTHVIIALYTDNLLIFVKSMISINAVSSKPFNEYKMKDIEKTFFILGIGIRPDVKRKQQAIDQSNYIRIILCDFGMEDFPPVFTSIDGYHALAHSELLKSRAKIAKYQIRIGSVMDVMVGTRPDIAFAVCKLSQYCQNPSVRH